MVTVGGYHDDRPTIDPDDFSSRLGSDPAVALYQFADRDDALTDVVTLRYPASVRRDYHRCNRLPGGFLATVLSAVDMAAQLTKQKDLDRLRTRLRDVWRRMLTSSRLCFTGDVLRQTSGPGARPATDLTHALDHLARESSRREVEDAIADGHRR